MKLSIIMPCYNMKIYIEEALRSAFLQTLPDIEVICVDDGSTDGTWELLQRLKGEYNNLKICSQENKGAGGARNKGIEAAKGEYIAFLDADDFYPTEQVLSHLYHTAVTKGANICGGSVYKYKNGIIDFKSPREGQIFSEEGWINKDNFPTYSGYWRFIYKREFLIENNIWFPNYRRFQDPPFFLKAIECAEKVYCISEATYIYRMTHKRVNFDYYKARDYAKGVFDSMVIAKNANMKKVYKSILQDLHGELSAIMYAYIAEGYMEMQQIVKEFNAFLSNDSESSKYRFLEGIELTDYLQQVQNEKEKLISALRRNEHILIFGAGDMGQRVLDFLQGMSIKPESFVVSNTSQNALTINGIAVKGIDEYISLKEKCFVIIAAYRKWKKEIQEALTQKGFLNNWALVLEEFFLWESLEPRILKK